MDLGAAVYDAWKNNVPGEARFFLQALLGDRSKPFTEHDLNSRELESLQQIISRADAIRPETLDVEEEWMKKRDPTGLASVANRRQRHAQGRGYVTYGDYRTGDDIPAMSPDMLGRFNYSIGPMSTRVTDNYDFNNQGREPFVDWYAQMGPLEKLTTALGLSSQSSVNASGNLRQRAAELGMAYLGKSGRPVDINIPRSVNRRGQ
jgi:hypothetical protein